MYKAITTLPNLVCGGVNLPVVSPLWWDLIQLDDLIKHVLEGRFPKEGISHGNHCSLEPVTNVEAKNSTGVDSGCNLVQWGGHDVNRNCVRKHRTQSSTHLLVFELVMFELGFHHIIYSTTFTLGFLEIDSQFWIVMELALLIN